MRIGIITGASSGLGRAYARHVDKILELDELWLIARREERLVALAEELETDCRILALDLREEESILTLRRTLEEERPQVELLVSAAGFGKFGRAEDLSLEETGDMISLNCRAAAEVTRVHPISPPGQPGAGGGLLRRFPAPARHGRLCGYQGLCAPLYPGSSGGTLPPGSAGDGGVSLLDQDRIHGCGPGYRQPGGRSPYPFGHAA